MLSWRRGPGNVDGLFVYRPSPSPECLTIIGVVEASFSAGGITLIKTEEPPLPEGAAMDFEATVYRRGPTSPWPPFNLVQLNGWNQKPGASLSAAKSVDLLISEIQVLLLDGSKTDKSAIGIGLWNKTHKEGHAGCVLISREKAQAWIVEPRNTQEEYAFKELAEQVQKGMTECKVSILPAQTVGIQTLDAQSAPLAPTDPRGFCAAWACVLVYMFCFSGWEVEEIMPRLGYLAKHNQSRSLIRQVNRTFCILYGCKIAKINSVKMDEKIRLSPKGCLPTPSIFKDL